MLPIILCLTFFPLAALTSPEPSQTITLYNVHNSEVIYVSASDSVSYSIGGVNSAGQTTIVEQLVASDDLMFTVTSVSGARKGTFTASPIPPLTYSVTWVEGASGFEYSYTISAPNDIEGLYASCTIAADGIGSCVETNSEKLGGATAFVGGAETWSGSLSAFVTITTTSPSSSSSVTSSSSATPSFSSSITLSASSSTKSSSSPPSSTSGAAPKFSSSFFYVLGSVVAGLWLFY